MVTGWVLLVFCEPDGGVEETGLESMLHPAMPSTMSNPALMSIGIHSDFRVNTGAP